MNIKEKIDQTVPAIIEKLGHRLNPLILNLKNENNQLLIFYFHGIYENEAQKEAHHVDPQNNVTVAQFDDFIEYFLSHKYHFIKPNDLLNGLEKDRPYIMMTFDDGYYNNQLAVKSLEKYEVPATFFVTARNVLENKSYWWDIIYKYRMKEGVSLEAIREEQQQLKSFQYDYIDQYTLEHFGPESNTPWSDIDRPFTPAELREFAQNPYVVIGNHTYHHTILTNYKKDKIIEEFESTNKALEEMVGYKPNTIAFPNGNYDELVLKASREVGFEFVFTVRPITMNLPIRKAGKEMVCLHRYMTRPQSIREYGSFCRAGYSPGLFYDKLKDKAMFYKRRRRANV